MKTEAGMNIGDLDWGKMNGLLPAIVQDVRTGAVLMLAFMNEAALEKTLATKRVTFWSRSRSALWTKGETSGHYLKLTGIRRDCDGDALLLLAEPEGPACHRGTRSCFGEDTEFSGLEFLGYLERLIEQRRQEMPSGSYTTSLFQKGLVEIVKKLGEESIEVVLSASQDRQRSVEETADLLYHTLVFLVERQIPLSEVLGELQRRHFK